jgi:hypothetical protein
MVDLHSEEKHPTMALFKSRMTRPDCLDYVVVNFWAILCAAKRRAAKIEG